MYSKFENILGWIVLILGSIGVLVFLFVLTASAIHFHTVKRLCICLLVIVMGIIFVLMHKEREKHE